MSGGRFADRQGMDQEVRIRLLERDMDDVNSDLREEVANLRSEMTREFAKAELRDQECAARDQAMRRLLTGLLVSIVLASFTMTAGVLVVAGGG